ncbi:MAG: hypothetical protein VW518_00415 [Burkholderiaceae bacterium]
MTDLLKSLIIMFLKLIKQVFFGRKDMTTTNVNYTAEATAAIVAAYTANPVKATVEALAESNGKSVRSIIAKLVREGVYQAQERVTKTGEPVVRKQDLVAQIEATTGVEFPSLVKASKADLVELAKFLEAA